MKKYNSLNKNCFQWKCSYGYVEGSFERSIGNFLTEGQNLSVEKVETDKSIIFLWKNFSPNSSYGNVECSCDNTAEQFEWHFDIHVENLTTESRKIFDQ